MTEFPPPTGPPVTSVPPGYVAYSSAPTFAPARGPHPTLPIQVAIGAMVVLTVSLIVSKYALNALVFSADSRRVYSASDDHTVRLWRADNCAFIKRVRSQAITRLALAGKRNVMLGATFKGHLMFMRQQKLVPYRVVQAHLSPIDSLAISPDGRQAATGARNGEIRIWNLR